MYDDGIVAKLVTNDLHPAYKKMQNITDSEMLSEVWLTKANKNRSPKNVQYYVVIMNIAENQTPHHKCHPAIAKWKMSWLGSAWYQSVYLGNLTLPRTKWPQLDSGRGFIWWSKTKVGQGEYCSSSPTQQGNRAYHPILWQQTISRFNNLPMRLAKAQTTKKHESSAFARAPYGHHARIKRWPNTTNIIWWILK